MPINVPNNLPSADALKKENMFIMHEARATSQDIRPLKILIVNLMPTKVETEMQLLRLLSNSPLQVDPVLVQMSTHVSKNTSQDYLDQFYSRFEDVRNRKWDGLIITGAPVETLEFEEVDYWDELCSVMDWSKRNVCSAMYICWGAQAGLYHNYGVRKRPLPFKKSGIFKHHILYADEPLVRGCNDDLVFPHSRNTEIVEEDVLNSPHLHTIAAGDETGPSIIISEDNEIFITGHMEYDPNTLASEYVRDLGKGLNPRIPEHYFPDDDPDREPISTWRSTAYLIFTNWLNYYVYQKTEFDINRIGENR